MQFKSLKSPSTFPSGGRILQMRSAHPITAWPSQTVWEKGNIAISLFTHPYRHLSHLRFTLLLHSFFLRPLPQRAVSLNHNVFWASGTRQSFTDCLQGARCCLSNHEPVDIYFWYLEVALGDWPHLISDTVGKNHRGLESTSDSCAWNTSAACYLLIFLQHPTTNLRHLWLDCLVNW